jgi:hypothetical protein
MGNMGAAHPLSKECCTSLALTPVVDTGSYQGEVILTKSQDSQPLHHLYYHGTKAGVSTGTFPWRFLPVEFTYGISSKSLWDLDDIMYGLPTSLRPLPHG